jgi:cytoskeleton protein RodZ
MMENHSDKNQDTQQAHTGHDLTQPASLGTMLREKRELLGLSVADVANQIKFAPRQIESLEVDDYQNLPESAFLRGFVRSYAKILQLDAEALLQLLPQHTTPATELQVPESVGVPFPNAHSLLRPNVILLAAAGLVALIAAGFAVWNYVSPRTHQSPVTVETPLALPPDTAVIAPPQEAGANEPVSTEADKVKESAEPAQRTSSTPVEESRGSKVETGTQSPVVKPASKTESKPAEYVEIHKPVVTPAPPATEEPKPVVMLGLTPSVKLETRTEPVSQPKPVDKPVPKPLPAAEMESVKKLPADTVAKAVARSAIPAIDQTANAGDITKLRLEFDEESWTEIRDRDDNIISSKVNQPGSVLVVRGRAPFKLLVGHGLSVRLFHQDKQIDLTPFINKYSEVAHVTVQ